MQGKNMSSCLFSNLNNNQQQFKNSTCLNQFLYLSHNVILLLHTVKKLNHYLKTDYGVSRIVKESFLKS